MTPSLCVKAASLVLISNAPQTSIKKVLLLKRSPHARFMPNALVFPGGQIDKEDQHSSTHLLLSSDFQWEAWGFISLKEAQSSLNAVLRETHEEAGFNLEEYSLHVQNFECFARWLTPPITKKRFDTFFWKVHLPDQFSPHVDGEEIVEGQWWSPHDALEAYQNQQIDLAAPTLRMLYDLKNDFESTAFSTPKVSPYAHPICPVIFMHDQTLSLCFFGDRMYQHVEQGGTKVILDRDDRTGPLNRVTKNPDTGRWVLQVYPS